MPTLATLIILQALGACVGTGMVVWGELAYVRAMRDGKVDVAERLHLDHIATALRFGMSLVLLSSLALTILAYQTQAAVQPALSSHYWILVALALLILWGSWALSRKRLSFAYGSALLFTAWWFLTFLTLGKVSGLTFGAAVAFFVVATVLFYVILRAARSLMLHKG